MMPQSASNWLSSARIPECWEQDVGHNAQTNGNERHDEPEFYCFEDFFPSEMGGNSYIVAEQHAYRDLLRKIENEQMFFKSKKLHRSKTLPVIDVANIISNAAAATSNTLHVRDGMVQRKFSAPGEINERDCFRPTSGLSGSGRNRSTYRQNRSASVDRVKSFTREVYGGCAWTLENDLDSTNSGDMVMTNCEDPITIKVTPQLYYTTPPRTNMVKGPDNERRLENPCRFYQFTSRLSQWTHYDSSTSPNRQRSVSLDCGDGRTLTMQTNSHQTVDGMSSLSASPSAPAFLSKILTTNPSPRSSRQLSSLTPRKKGSVGDIDGISPNKVERRRSEKEKKPSYDIGILFHAVEQQELELVKVILDTSCVQINSLNSENLTPLDVAVMTNNIPMAKMLLQHGARESPLFQQGECRLDRLEMLVAEAEKKVVDLTAVVLNGSSGNVNISPAQQKETENQLCDWEYRHRLLKRMKAGYDHARPPDPPTKVCLSVMSSSSLLVSFGEPVNHNGSVVTKYKIEWSFAENFTSLAGEATLEDVRQLEFEIKKLHNGEAYFVRVAAWNMKGYSDYMPSNPPYAVPSNWRAIDGLSSRSEGKVESLQALFQQVKQCRPADASEIRESPVRGSDSPLQRKRMSIKNLFISTPKFQKSLKRGVYIACLLYNGDRVLVTSEEQLPIVEVDENFSGTSIQSELYWIMKIASTWDDVKSLRRDMDKSSSAGVVHFRNKLLQAASLLQNSLGIHDLGQFYHKPLKDTNGSILLVTVNHVHDTKFVALGSSKWVSLGKLARRLSLAGNDTGIANAMLIQTIPEMIVHHQVSSISLPRGLYLGYLKLHCTVENINVLVQQKTPNVLPHVKVRDTPNVSREEWEYIQSLNGDQDFPANQPLKEFHAAIGKACRRLLDMLGLPPGSDHRLYDLEVIELSPGISFILVLPPAEDVFIVPGQTEELTDRQNLVFLPVQVFEMIHMSTYQQTFISHYSRLSSILEMDINLAQQAQRQAFSPEEVSIAKDRVDVMVQLQQNLDMLWKSVRWVMDIITFARDRNMRGGIPISKFLSSDSEANDTPKLSRKSKIHDNNNSSSSASCNSNEISVGKDNRKIAKFYDPNEDNSSSNEHSCDSDVSASSSPPTSGVLRVYAAYDCGLSKGISVKLNVTLRTTARDVINLVVRQLNKAVVTRCKEGPVYSDEELDDFCLVAVIGARERILRDDYQPLQLQNPWTKGRLYVRLRNNLLAAIQQGHATAV